MDASPESFDDISLAPVNDDNDLASLMEEHDYVAQGPATNARPNTLIRSVHNVVLLFGNSATTRLAQHLVQSFFLCTDTKTYLKNIFGLAEKHQDIVVLKLNAVASYRPHSAILALTNIERLFNSFYCFAYPELNHLETMEHKTVGFRARMPALEGERLQEAFVLLPASRVQEEATPSADTAESDCLKDKAME